jgi:tetratricopeptide (TPR) repeat protein
MPTQTETVYIGHDNTINIINQYSNVIVRHIEFENFVSSKNKALEFAEEIDCDYILFMDADEYFENPEDPKILRNLIEEFDHESYITNIVERYDTVLTYPRVRIWKNNKGFRFQGPGVHEYIDTPLKNSFLVSNILVRHCHNHRVNFNSEERYNKYIEILENHKRLFPDDPRTLFYLGQTYQILNKKSEAIQNYSKYLDVSTFPGEKYLAYLELANLLPGLELHYLQQAQFLFPDKAEAYFRHGVHLYNKEEFSESIPFFEKALQFSEKRFELTLDDCFVYTKEYYELPLDYLVFAYDKVGMKRSALEAAKKLVEYRSDEGILDKRNLNNIMWLVSEITKKKGND